MLQVWVGSRRVCSECRNFAMENYVRGFLPCMGIGHARVRGRKVCVDCEREIYLQSRVKAPQENEATHAVGIGFLNHIGFYVHRLDLQMFFFELNCNLQGASVALTQLRVRCRQHSIVPSRSINLGQFTSFIRTLKSSSRIIHCPLNISTAMPLTGV